MAANLHKSTVQNGNAPFIYNHANQIDLLCFNLCTVSQLFVLSLQHKKYKQKLISSY